MDRPLAGHSPQKENSIRRAHLIAILLIFIFLFLLVAQRGQAHTQAECLALSQQLQDWSKYETVQGISGQSLSLLQALLDERREWCNPPPTDQARLGDSTHGGSTSQHGAEQWRGLVTQYFTEGKVDTALCILFHESRGNPEAKNSQSTAAGLFQFLKGTWDNMVPASVTGGSYASGQVYQPEANVRSAAWLQNAAGWTQWSPYKAGKCRGL